MSTSTQKAPKTKIRQTKNPSTPRSNVSRPFIKGGRVYPPPYPPPCWTPPPTLPPKPRSPVPKLRSLTVFSAERRKNLVPQQGPSQGSFGVLWGILGNRAVGLWALPARLQTLETRLQTCEARLRSFHPQPSKPDNAPKGSQWPKGPEGPCGCQKGPKGPWSPSALSSRILNTSQQEHRYYLHVENKSLSTEQPAGLRNWAKIVPC